VDKYASVKTALIVKIELFVIFRCWRIPEMTPAATDGR
jgi:hypothetical protein